MDLVEAQARGFAPPARHPWERARLALVAQLIARHAPLRAGDVVLDIGCGDIFVAESLALRYPDVRFYAVDSAFTPELIQMFTSRSLAPNVSLFASLDEVPADCAASLVLLMDVLEHVPDDHALLGEIVRGRTVAAGARVLITVPAYQGLFCTHDTFLGHYRRYSTPAFQALSTSSGLTPIISGHLFASLLLPRAVQVLAERMRPTHDVAPTVLASWSGSEGLARSMAAVLEWDGRLALALLRLGVHLPGLSNFAVCRTSV